MAASAQTFTGRVVDKSGAVIQHGSITVHNEETGVDTVATTTASGDYTVPYLKPGLYSVVAVSAGFQKQSKTHITLQTGQTASIDFVLGVGATETVSVTDDTLLDRNKADRGEVVENTRVTELPLNGRDPNMLSILNAGAVWSGSIAYQRPFDDTQQNLSINGGGAGNNELMLDGVSNEATPANSGSNAKIAYVPPVDSVQEFKITTNPYDAQYGRASGGVVDMSLKSGTNQLHGDIYEFARRSWLDANTWQNDYLAPQSSNPSQYSKAAHKLDQYGAELDGPIFLPKLYDGRDKSFFLAQYENWNEIVPGSLVTSVPDPAWKNGDFSNLTYWTGSAQVPITIYDPLTLHKDSSGAYVRDPFPNNKIPLSRMNPVGRKILSYYPSPNVSTSPGTNLFANNYATPNPTTDRYRNALAKWDQNFSPKDRFTLRYGYWERVETGSSNGMPGPVARGSLPLGERSHTFATDLIHTFTPRLLFDFRGVVSVRTDYKFPGPTGFDNTSLGWSSAEVDQLGAVGASHFPNIEPSEFAYLGNSGPSQSVSNSMSLFPSVTWTKSNHTLHAGLDLRILQYVVKSSGGGPFFWEDREWTQSNYIEGDWTSDSGNSIASLLLGLSTPDGKTSINARAFWSQKYIAPFVQDDWKVTPRLTLNLGVRYDLNMPQTERHNQATYGFDTSATSPVDSLVNHSLLPGGITLKGGLGYLGVNGNPRTLYSVVKTNIQPRVGFAYSVNPDLVVRGGFGEMFRNPTVGGNQIGYSSTTNFDATLDNGMTPYNTLSNPFPTVVQPTGSSLGLSTDLGQTPWFINPHYKVPSFWNFSFGVQQKILKYDMIELSYVGSRTYNIDSSDNIDHESASYNAKCNLDMGGNPGACNNAYVGNPFVGVAGFQGSTYYSAPTILEHNLTRPMPQFQDVIEYQLNQGRSAYNSLQLTGLHRWKDSLTLHGTWTWSKIMDSGGWADETYRVAARGLDGQDRTHRITISGVYMLPVGRGRTLLGNANRIIDGAIGGWELGSLYVYETGTPWSVPNNPSVNYLRSAYTERHIESTGYIRGVKPCAQHWVQNGANWNLQQITNYSGYTGSCSGASFSVVPDYGEYQNNVATGIRIPNDHQFDVNLSKNLPIYDRVKLQLRLEAFNVLNHPLWQESYEGSVQDSNFGTIERGAWGQSNLPRQIQIAAKLMW